VRLAADAERDADVALRVDVDEQHPQARLGEARGDVDGRGGLARAALVVEHRDAPRVVRCGGVRSTFVRHASLHA
jgi:hypothetical protein